MANKKKKTEFLPYLTGLRAYAALLVFTIHAGQFIPQSSPVVAKIVGFGSQGVPIFFFLSALTLSLSIDSKQSFSYLKYLLQRVRRIFPLYYFFMLLGFTFEWARRGGDYFRQMYQVHPDSLSNIFYHVTFLNFFHQKYLLTLTGIDSMIPFEFFYYLWIPLFYYLALLSPVFILPIILLGAVFYFNPTLHLPFYYTIYASGDLTFERHLITYGSGVLLFSVLFRSVKARYTSFDKLGIVLFGGTILLYIAQYLRIDEKLIYGSLILLILYSSYGKERVLKRVKYTFIKSFLSNTDIVLLFVILLWYLFTAQTWINLFTTVFTAALIACCYHGGQIVKWLFENRLILHMGKISFSFYLLHLIVITTLGRILANGNLLHFFLLLIVTGCIATLTHKYIEAPFYRPRNAVAKAEKW